MKPSLHSIILICKYLPRWWRVDARKAAKEYEVAHGVPNVDDAGLSGYRPFDLRAYRLVNPELDGHTIAQLRERFAEYQIENVERGDKLLGADSTLTLQLGDVIALGGSLASLTEHMGVIGPEVPDARALNIPLDQAEIVVTHKDAIGRALKDFSHSPIAGQVQLVSMERGGAPLPVGLETRLQCMDILHLVGLRSAIDKATALLGKAARPSTATDLLTLSLGMILGFLIGLIQVPAFGASVGLGNAGGLLVSGIIVSSLVSRVRFFGNTPNAARNILEDMGLIFSVAIVGVNAGANLLSQLNGTVGTADLWSGLRCMHHPSLHRLGGGISHLQDQSGRAHGRCRGCTQPLGPCSRGVQGNRQHRALDRVSLGVRRFRDSADGLWLLCNGPRQMSVSLDRCCLKCF